jgi:SAM-dependent methyltransferase
MGRATELAVKPFDVLRRMSDMEQPGSLSAKLRQQRLARFDAFLEAADESGSLALEDKPKILDVGGTVNFWERLNAVDRFDLTILNLGHDQPTKPGVRLIVADGTRLPFADKSFTVAFSNSVIEHVGGPDDQARMLDELQRVAHAVFLQTPCRWFPIEPHFHFPFFAVLPLEVRVRLMERLGLGHGGKCASRDEARGRVLSTELMRKSELRRFAPGLQLEYERFLAWPKCYLLSGTC